MNDVVKFIQEYVQRTGDSPLQSEIAAALRVKESTVWQQVQRLLREGILVKDGRKPRGISVAAGYVQPAEKPRVDRWAERDRKRQERDALFYQSHRTAYEMAVFRAIRRGGTEFRGGPQYVLDCLKLRGYRVTMEDVMAAIENERALRYIIGDYKDDKPRPEPRSPLYGRRS